MPRLDAGVVTVPRSDAGAPGHKRRHRLVVHAGPVGAPVRHPVVRRKDVGSPSVVPEIRLHRLRRSAGNFIFL